MARATIDGCTVAYDVYGSGRPWVITPGGRFSKDSKEGSYDQVTNPLLAGVRAAGEAWVAPMSRSPRRTSSHVRPRCARNLVSGVLVALPVAVES